jgi:hypothetical protein
LDIIMGTPDQPLATRVLLLLMSAMLGVAGIFIIGWMGLAFAFAYGWIGIGALAVLLVGVAGLFAWLASLGRRLR